MRVAAVLSLFALSGLSSAASDYFTISSLGALVPSGYDGSTYTASFKIEDKNDATTAATCTASWKSGKAPSNYITCDKKAWQWKFSGAFTPCAFNVNIAHSVVASGKNTTSYGTLSSSQVPCGVRSSSNGAKFGCVYATSGAEICGLASGQTLQVPVTSTTTKKA